MLHHTYKQDQVGGIGNVSSLTVTLSQSVCHSLNAVLVRSVLSSLKDPHDVVKVVAINCNLTYKRAQ